MAAAIVSGNASIVKNSARHATIQHKGNEAKGVAGKERAASEIEELDQDDLLHMQCNLRARGRQPLSLAHLEALPVPLYAYKKSATRGPAELRESRRDNVDLSAETFSSGSGSSSGGDVSISIGARPKGLQVPKPLV